MIVDVISFDSIPIFLIGQEIPSELTNNIV